MWQLHECADEPTSIRSKKVVRKFGDLEFDNVKTFLAHCDNRAEQPGKLASKGLNRVVDMVDYEDGMDVSSRVRSKHRLGLRCSPALHERGFGTA